jgi:hypothetical protein
MAPSRLSPALALVLVGGFFSSAPAETFSPNLVVPAYFYPEPNDPGWDALAVSPRGSAIVIINPDSGPGERIDPNFTRVIAACRADGLRLAGYVDTNYTKIPIIKLVSQIDEYRVWYGITDIFLDECAAEAPKAGYYRKLTGYVKAQQTGAITLLNPGTVPDESYMNAGDILCVFEDSFAAFRKASFPSWMSRYPPTRFLEIIYNVPLTDLVKTMRAARKNGAGYFFATDENQTAADPGSPYDHLPSYYPKEVSLATHRPAAPTAAPEPTGPK